jgi:hypothetical protein
MTDQSRLTWALVLSVLLHGLLLSLVPLAGRARIQIPTPPLVDVDLLPLPKVARQAPAIPAPAPVPAPAPAAPPAPAVPAPKQQIVSPPDAGEEKEPKDARLLSDRNNTVKEEMIHRGEPAPGDPDARHQTTQHQASSAPAERQPPARRAPPPRPAANTQVAALPKLDQLLPQPGDLIREGLMHPDQAESAPAPEQHASNERQDLLRHGDPWHGGDLRGGSLDFLPNVREGDVTLLNTKAEQFAPFVRRVGMRVFESFWILVRRSIGGGVPESVEESTTIEAVMDRQGHLLEMNTKDRSLSVALATDRNLQQAIREGFFDRNPPPGAESSDGKIHFVFDVRVALLVQPGRGVAGYRALFGAGLL